MERVTREESKKKKWRGSRTRVEEVGTGHGGCAGIGATEQSRANEGLPNLVERLERLLRPTLAANKYLARSQIPANICMIQLV